MTLFSWFIFFLKSIDANANGCCDRRVNLKASEKRAVTEQERAVSGDAAGEVSKGAMLLPMNRLLVSD